MINAKLMLFSFAAWRITSLTAFADPLVPAAATAALKTPEGVEVSLFAAEPMLTNPTNIDIDHRGRVWVCDVMNYRGNQGARPEGDRILILEDADGDGRADSSKVFYQGADVDSALGICVLPDPNGKTLRVIVSCSPNVWLFTDDDGDDLPDRKEPLFTKTGIPQHDHSAHAFVFGPDGMFYWNVGNTNDGVFDRDGQVVADIFGREVRPTGKPYRQGMAFRSNLDLNNRQASNFEVLAHNLRNSYELTVNSFGDVWFSDNDDDGNQATRICYTLNGGNYGYLDEMTGQHWRAHEWTGMSDEIPLRHWHQTDPGVVPNVANMGSGSPSGIVLYEGDALPTLRGKLLHCEPGHNVFRAFTIATHGAGYTATPTPLVDGRADQWFRPVDAAVAPDGSVLVADWYDPGVGGHHQGDTGRGRIYRVAAKTRATGDVLEYDFTSPEGAAAALGSPCQSVRYTAWTTLEAMGAAAEDALVEMGESDDPVLRVRALSLLSRLPGSGADFVKQAASDENADVRRAAVRMAQQRGDVLDTVKQLVDDSSPQVRCQCAIALRYIDNVEIATPLWRTLAEQLPGDDRWMLEALGLSADGRWDVLFDHFDSDPVEIEDGDAFLDLAWRGRGEMATYALGGILGAPEVPDEDVPRLLRAIDFQLIDAKVKDDWLPGLIVKAKNLPEERRLLITAEAVKRVKRRPLDRFSRNGLDYLLDKLPHDERFIDLVQEFQVVEYYDELLALALSKLADTSSGVDVLRFLLEQDYAAAIGELLSSDEQDRGLLVRMLANSNHGRAVELLRPLVTDATENDDVRREALRAVAAHKFGAEKLVALAEEKQLDQPLTVALAYALRGLPWDELTERAERLCPELPAAETEKLPIDKWVYQRGNVGEGKRFFFGKANCSTCHKVGDEGKEVGPALTEIGSKLSHRGLYEAILYPSAAISHNYETYAALTDAGLAITGVLIGETDETVTLKTDKAVVHQLRRDELEAFEKQSISLMPAGLQRTLEPWEIGHLVEYLTTLRKESTN